jgi:putative oxidoreductase
VSLGTLEIPATEDILRVVCGLFFLPHLALKFVFLNDTAAFFRRAGFKHPIPTIGVDACVEAVSAAMLIGKLYVPFAACVAAAHLLVAAGAVWIANGHTWRWNRGGPEYCLFWAIMCLVVAKSYWP